MNWIDDNKGQGPWDFVEQPNKWGYLNNPRWTKKPEPASDHNYDNNPYDEPQIWAPYEKGPTVTDGSLHFLCGHWHKRITPSTAIEVDLKIELWYELLTSQSAMPHMSADIDSMVAIDALVEIPTDGGTYTFEVIGKNAEAFDVTVSVIDSSGTECSSITIPAGSEGASTYELYRYTADFIEGDGTYTLKIAKPSIAGALNSPGKTVVLGTARIKLYKESPINARVQIPLIAGGFNYYFNEDDDEEGSDINSIPVGYSIYNSFGNTSLNDFTTVWGLNNERGKEVTSIWKYSSSELDTVNKVTFSVAIKPQVEQIAYLPGTIVTTWGQTGFDLLLYTAPSGTSWAVSHGVGDWVDSTSSFTDVNGVTFSPLSDTYYRYENPVVGETITLNINQAISTPDDCEVHIGGVVYGYVGSVPGDADRIENFGGYLSLSLSASETLYIKKITYTQTSDTTLDFSAEYFIADTDVPSISAALWNITLDTIVPNSTMIWDAFGEYERKEAEISLSDNCEYEVRVKCPGQTSSKQGTDPQLIDAQLWIDVGPISVLTEFYRIGRFTDSDWDEWNAPISWGSNCDPVWESDGSISIGCRGTIHSDAFPYITKVYFEGTGYIAFEGESAECYKWYVSDTTADDVDGDADSSVDVTNSAAAWNSTDRSRQRSSEITLENEHIYSSRLTCADAEYLISSNGFLICKYEAG